MAEGALRPQTPKHVRERRQRRHSRLVGLGYKDYGDYLGSPHWKAIKARYRASDLPQECVCGETEVQLHHMTYERIGDEALTDLTPLCHPCHALIHVLEYRGEIDLGFRGFFDEGRAIEGRKQLLQFAEQQRRNQEERLRNKQQEVLGMSFASRLIRVRNTARFHRHLDISQHLFILRQMVQRKRSSEDLTRKLRSIEELVYGWEGWRDAA